MTDEEKKAIEIIKFLQDKCIQENGTGMMPIYRIDDLVNAIETVLNLIEKQSKEIEELKEDKYGLEEEVQIQAKNLMLCEDALREMQDKIKAKIEEINRTLHDDIYVVDGHYDDRYYRYLQDKQVLQSLLEKE